MDVGGGVDGVEVSLGGALDGSGCCTTQVTLSVETKMSMNAIEMVEAILEAMEVFGGRIDTVACEGF
jgi:hypothetical protein